MRSCGMLLMYVLFYLVGWLVGPSERLDVGVGAVGRVKRGAEAHDVSEMARALGLQKDDTAPLRSVL